jgi:GntR family transcriptional regulator
LNDGMIRQDPRPLYEQVQSALIGRIMGGTYASGQQLPPEDELAAGFGVSRTTMRTALGNLETLGYIHRVHGAGTFVAQQHFKVEAQLDTLETFHPQLAARMGRKSRITGLQIREMTADAEVVAAMGLRPGDIVVAVTRVIEIDEVPVVHLEEFLPTGIASAGDLQADFRDSLVGYLDGKEGRPRVEWSESDLGAARADQALAEILHVQPGDILFRLDETLYTAEAKLVLWSRIHISSEYFKFHVRRRILHSGMAEDAGYGSGAAFPARA